MDARTMWAALAAVGGLACGGGTTTTTTGEVAERELPEGVVLDEAGSLGAGDMEVGSAYSDHYELPVRAGDVLVVSVESESFDPVLEVTPPGEGAIVNDDYQGDRNLSRVEVVPSVDGPLKVRVTSYGQGAEGDYRITVARPNRSTDPAAPRGAQAAAILLPGGALQGRLEEGDGQLPDGRYYEPLLVDVAEGRPMTLRVEGEGGTPTLIVADPQGRYHEVTSGQAALSHVGLHRVQVVAPAANETLAYAARLEGGSGSAAPTLSREHHRAPAEGTPQHVQIGQRVEASLAEDDTHLPSGELADLYAFEGHPGRPVEIEMEAEGLDAYLMVLGPHGEVWEDDDSGGGLNAKVSLRLPSRGEYRVVATTYRAGMTGAYELKVFEPGRAHVATAGAAPATDRSSQQGTLGSGDTRLRSGEYYDTIDVQWQAGQQVQVDLTSDDFDTYLIVRTPDGEQLDNDDVQPGSNTNSSLTIPVRASGPHQILVTSYASGETGAYSLTVSGGGGAPERLAVAERPRPAQPTTGWQRHTGQLAQGDAQLRSGELVDDYELSFPAGAHVRLEARSTEFDTYLIVVDPAGEQHDNDDATPGNTNAALGFVARAGTYRVRVTSYRPGETGAYELMVRGGEAQVAQTQPATQPTTQPATQPAAQPAGEAQRLTGSLAEGDERLESGELVDRHVLNLTAGQATSIRLRSTAFDTYLVLRSPSGHQLDNDDIAPGTLNSGIDIPSAEAGQYVALVTSYRPGETGDYELLVGPAGSMPGPTPEGSRNMLPPDGEVYGIFAGISDYPGNGSDLPECANDAIKLAQSLRESNLMPEANQILLTDSAATRDAVRQAMRQMGQRVGANDTFVFFYSGHGNRTQGTDDEREIDGADESIVLYDGEMLDDEMGELFGVVNGRLSVLALDACFAGGFAKDVITEPGRMGLFSSEEDVLSSVAAQFQAGGYLSHFLRTGMSGEADNAPRDRVLTAGELGHYMFNQFGTHVRDVRLAGAFQHLVVDRGGVPSDFVMFAY